MNLRRIGRATCVVLLVGAAVAPLAARGQTPAVEVGWWARLPGATAPEGGIEVANAPDDARSVGAFRFDLGTGATSVSLTLPEVGGVAPELAGIDVCPTYDPWVAVAGGAWTDAPVAQCANAIVPLARAADGSTWKADITSVLTANSGVVSVVLVPRRVQPADLLTGFPAFEVDLGAPEIAVVRPPTTDDGGGDGFDFDASPGPVEYDDDVVLPFDGIDLGNLGLLPPTTVAPAVEPTPVLVEESAFSPRGGSSRLEEKAVSLATALLFVLLAAAAGTGTAFTKRFVDLRTRNAT